VRAAEWFQSIGNSRRAARHLLAANEVDRALAVMRDGVVTDFLRDPALPTVPDLRAVPASVLAAAPDRLLGLAADLLTSGYTADGGHYLDLLERAQPSLLLDDSMLAARFAALRCLRFALAGRVEEALDAGLTARSIQATSGADQQFETTIPLVLLRVYTWLEDLDAVEREAAAVLALPSASEPVRAVLVPGAQALAWFEFGRLSAATEAATAAQNHATALGFDRHFFAVGLPAGAGRGRPGAAEHRYRGTAHRAGTVHCGASAAPRSSFWHCSTGPRSGPSAASSATPWRRLRRRAPS
jgi:ATP/maltotriose-dependent transcriptional regulator MalT